MFHMKLHLYTIVCKKKPSQHLLQCMIYRVMDFCIVYSEFVWICISTLERPSQTLYFYYYRMCEYYSICPQLFYFLLNVHKTHAILTVCVICFFVYLITLIGGKERILNFVVWSKVCLYLPVFISVVVLLLSAYLIMRILLRHSQFSLCAFL